MLWISFILDLNFLCFCCKLIKHIHYHTRSNKGKENLNQGIGIKPQNIQTLIRKSQGKEKILSSLLTWNMTILYKEFKSNNQRIATKQTSLCGEGLWFWPVNGRDTLIGGFELTCIPQMPLVEIFALVMLRKLVLQLQDRFSREILEGMSSHSDGAWIHI